jgi:hypothetical protein
MAGGRPTLFRPEFCQEAEQLCTNGATDEEIADFFEVSVRSIYRWKAEFPEFCQALKTGKDVADERVERSLYAKAIGYTFESEKVFQFQGQIVRTPVKEHVPPDTTAAIFWLKNRRGETWRDKSEVHHKHSVDSMTDGDLERIAANGSEGVASPPVGSTKLN